MLLTRLSLLLGTENRKILKRYLVLMCLFCLVQGVTFAMVVPVIRALLLGKVALAALWLIPLILGTLLTWYLNYVVSMGALRLRLLYSILYATELATTLSPCHWAGLPRQIPAG